jgi:hypothetical protein
VAVSDDKQQTTFAPGCHAAVFACCGLQLALQQLLQTIEPKGFAEQSSERLRFAQQ